MLPGDPVYCSCSDDEGERGGFPWGRVVVVGAGAGLLGVLARRRGLRSGGQWRMAQVPMSPFPAGIDGEDLLLLAAAIGIPAAAYGLYKVLDGLPHTPVEIRQTAPIANVLDLPIGPSPEFTFEGVGLSESPLLKPVLAGLELDEGPEVEPKPMWTPPPDANWLGRLHHPCVVLIIGMRGSGKSGLGYRVLELFRGPRRALCAGPASPGPAAVARFGWGQWTGWRMCHPRPSS